VTYGTGPLSSPSMPEFPGLPSRENVRRWLKDRRQVEKRGIELLMEHYGRCKHTSDFLHMRSILERRSLARPSLESEKEQLGALVLVLATDHVPFFGTRRRKRAAIDNHVLALLLDNYQQERRKGRNATVARSKARDAKNLEGKLARASDRRIENLLVRARAMFRALISIEPDASIRPRGDFEARIWHFHLNGPSRRSEDAIVEWSANDPNGVVVFDSKVTE
jgi:hypothetical protein